MDEIELKAYLTERVLSFCTRWNSIEKYCVNGTSYAIR